MLISLLMLQLTNRREIYNKDFKDENIFIYYFNCNFCYLRPYIINELCIVFNMTFTQFSIFLTLKPTYAKKS